MGCVIVLLDLIRFCLQNYFFNDTTKAFEVYAQTDIGSGEEVFICYGKFDILS